MGVKLEAKGAYRQMDYMFLVYTTTEKMNHGTEAEKMAGRERAYAVLDDAVAKGVFKAANPLQPPSTAVTSRIANGKVMATDGPFAETKEFLAGYWIIDCQDIDEAKAWASRLVQEGCSATSVEIRQIAPLPERPSRQNQSEIPHLVNA
jgi:hypothetical protein